MAVARFDLGLSLSDFWDLSLVEFMFLLDRMRIRENREDWRAGMVAAVIANVNRDSAKKRDPFKPADFMPRAGPSYQTPEQMLAVVKTLQLLYEGD